MGNNKKSNCDKPKIILVPPRFERDTRSQTRMSRSEYRYMFGKDTLRWLFRDYLQSDVQGKILLSPSMDSGCSMKAWANGKQGSMSIRFQPLGAHNPNTFAQFRIRPQAQGEIGMRASFFLDQIGTGIFCQVPLASQLSGKVPEVGLRYCSPAFTCGVISTPNDGKLKSCWLGAFYNNITVGAELYPDTRISSPLQAFRSLTSEKVSGAFSLLTKDCSFGVSYSTPTSQPNDLPRATMSFEMLRGKSLTLSYQQHFSYLRPSLNPLDEDTIAGVMNYVDLGVQVSAPISAAATSNELPPTMGAAVAWQASKNLMLKGAITSSQASAAVGVRCWFDPSLLFSFCTQIRFNDGAVGHGISLQVDNFGDLRFIRGTRRKVGVARGGLYQCHTPSGDDLQSLECQGTIVWDSEVQGQIDPQKYEEHSEASNAAASNNEAKDTQASGPASKATS